MLKTPPGLLCVALKQAGGGLSLSLPSGKPRPPGTWPKPSSTAAQVAPSRELQALGDHRGRRDAEISQGRKAGQQEHHGRQAGCSAGLCEGGAAGGQSEHVPPAPLFLKLPP